MSLMIASSASPERRTASAYSNWRGVSSVSISRPLMPMTPFIGVRISWLMVARNALLARDASRASSRATRSCDLEPLAVRDIGEGRHRELDRAGVVEDWTGPHVEQNPPPVRRGGSRHRRPMTLSPASARTMGSCSVGYRLVSIGDVRPGRCPPVPRARSRRHECPARRAVAPPPRWRSTGRPGRP